MSKIYNRAKYFEALKGEVGITSVREFVAELSNPLFREKLQSIKNINNMSLWQKIVEAIKKFLNIHSSSDYYTRAMNTLNNALDAFDKSTYMEYNGILDELRKSQDGKHILSTKAKAFLNTLSDEEVNNITSVINREISDYKLATEEQSSKRSKQYFTFDDGTQVETPFTLNEQQAKALNEMNRFIHSDETAMTLSGYAGTGKTSLMEMLRNRAWKEGKDVLFTATTNKATAVLKSKVGDGAMTLNKAFGISVEVNTSKAYDAKNLVNKIKESNHIHYGSIVVIDEASMINETNYAVLNDIARNLGAKIIYVGDSAQLAPVKETKISKVFRDENGKTIELTQVERTGDNAILREATDVRNGKGLSGISSFNKEGKGVAYLRPQQKKEIGDIVRHFLPQIKENPDNFKIIAFTNNKVASYNEAVRKTLGYNDSTPRVGEPIMGYLNYGYRKGGSYDFINSENYKVIHVSPAHTNTIVVNGTVYETTVNDVTLEGPDGETHTFAFTDVKHNQHNRQVAYTLGNIVAKLWETYKWSHDRDIPGRINAINTALFINDDIKEGDRTIVPKVYDFGYAITAHKSQGSTFKNVLIDDVDIQTAREGDVDLSTPADNYDVADPSSMMPAGKVVMNDVHDMNGATELSSASFSLGEEVPSETKPVTKPHSDTVSLVQQLEYVAISRATDTATIISDNVKKEGSPLHPEKDVNNNSNDMQQPIEQPISSRVSTNDILSKSIQQHRGNWSRQEASQNPRTLYVFTDNTDRDSGHNVIPDDSWYSKKYGKGHHFPTMTAAVIRGLDNSRPISTQRWYHQGAKGITGRWTDADVNEFKRVITDELQEIVDEFKTGKYDIIMFPDGDGLFNTRISNISKNRTPLLYQTLANVLHSFGFDKLIPSDVFPNEGTNTLSNSSKMITSQLISHLKSQGINVFGREAMAGFLKTHNLKYLQQAVEEQKEMDTIKQKAIADGTFMKAPNGKSTNLNERQWLQVRTTNFKNWFGDWENNPKEASKVVDKNGEPLVVYHYTTTQFNTFDLRFFGRNDHGDLGEGFYVTPTSPKEDTEKHYDYFKKGYGNIIMPLFINMRNPISEDTAKELGITWFTRRKKPFKSLKKDLQDKIEKVEFTINDLKEKLFGDDPDFSHYREEGSIANKMTKLDLQDYETKLKELKEKLATIKEDYDINAEYNAKIERLKKYDGVINGTFEILVPSPNQIKSATDNNGNFSLTDDNIQAAYNIDNSNINDSLTDDDKENILREVKKINRAKRTLIDTGGNSLFLVDHTDREGLEVLTKEQQKKSFLCKAKIDISGLGREKVIQVKDIAKSIIHEEGISGTLQTLGKELERNGFDGRLYNSDSIDAEVRSSNLDNAGLDKQTLQGETKRGQSTKDSSKNLGWSAIKRDSVTGRIAFADGNGKAISTSKEWNNAFKDGQLFTTPQGEIYGFVDKDGNIYLDETKISPEHPIHEYTHLWDKTVQQKNPKLWQRGVELMKQTSLWNEILNDERYGKVWQTQSLSQEELDNLVASEVHARFTGKGGEQLLEKLTKEKGQEGIIEKLKQWILDVWKDLKATFGNWSQEDIDKLTLKDFNHMTVRDFADGINLKDAENATYTQQQHSEPNQSTMPDLPEGPIKPSQPQKVSLPGYEHFDRMIKNGEQKGIEVDAEWKIPLLKELDSKIYNPLDDYEALGLKYDEERKLDRLNNEFNINQMNVLLRRVHSKDDWNNLELRNKLIKEEYEQNQYDKLARQIDNLNNPDNSDFDTPLTSSQVKQGVEMAMDYASDIITRLQAEGEEYAKEVNPNFQPKRGFNFNTASRQEVIEAVGLSNIFNAVYEWFDYRNDWCDSDEALDEAGDKMSYFHDNWDAVMWMGAPFFNFNEGFGFKEQIGGTVERAHEDNQLPHNETYNKEDEEDVLVELFGEGREHYLVDSRTIDTLASMSTTVKRALHECYKLDEDGNPIVNRTWGLKERINVKDSTISILSWTQGAVSYEDMLAKISQKAKLKKNNWVNQLLIKLNDNSGQYTDFQSQFFNVFCKHRTAYTVAIDDDGKIKSIPANKNPVLKQVMDAAKAKFNAEETPLFTSRRVNAPLLGNKETVSDKYAFNLHQAYNELDTLDKSLDIRINYQRRRKALTGEQIEKASETLSRVMQAVGFTFVKEEVEDILDESSLHQMTNALYIILKEMSRANDYKTKNPNSKYEIAPFSYTSDNGITGALKNLIKPITDSLEEVNQNTVYDDGKLYQEFTIPSFLSKLCQKFAIRDEEKFDDFLAEEYGKSEFFSMGHSYSRALNREEYKWRVPWLSMMDNGSRMNRYFDHRVNLSYKGKGYMKKMSDLEYAMSVLSQYWSMSSNMRDHEPSYFRMPMQSNKPTEDYIGFVAFRDKKTYKKDIIEGYKGDSGLYSMFLMELSRIQTVRMRNKDVKKDSSAIKNFDTNGRNFCFFKFLNPYLNGLTNKGDSMNLLAPERVFDDNGNAIENHDDAKFASLLQKKVKGEEALTSEEELELGELAKKAIRNYLQNRFDGILDSWKENGLIKAARGIANIAEFPERIENKFDENNQKAEYDEREKEIDSYIRGQLENFLWNDYFATKNILMLTVGDTAFYKDEEDLQKRLAQLHAPGVRGRVSAIDYNGKPVSDGKYRTVILKDFDKVKSNIIAIITEVFDRKIATAPDNMKAQWKALKESVLKAYSEINVADAEGYTSPTAYRKKAIMFGKWSKEAEAVYQKISKGETVNFTEIKQAFQPLKPFVYSHLQKPMGIDNAPITNMYCPFQAKNSEYLLVMADVLLRNEKTSRPNLLRAIFDVMEDSAFDGRQRDKDGKVSEWGTYNGKGIDTIQFESAIKSSLQGAVDIAKFANNLVEGEKKAKDALHDAIYKAGTEGYNSSAYNTDVFVHELPFEDYCLQQDVPDHFKDHEQAHGSQTRMIIPSDLEEYYDEKVGKDNPDNIVKYEYDEWQEVEKGKWEKVHISKTAKEIKEEYENTIYDNIVASLDNLVQELHLGASSRVEQNLALSKILQRELHSSPRYGIDLIQACTIDKVTGEFRIPKGDPIQCKRIEQLINSIIKNRVNKQLIPGGPIVQVSNFGTSRQLQIRFNDKKGELLPTREEYDASKHDGKSYEDYCKENQGGIAYFEVFAPAWSEDLYRNFADKDGTIDVETLNDIDPDLLKLITYRIPTEDKCSIAPCKIVGFLPKEAGSTIMLPYELTSQDGSDFDIDKRYVMRKALDIVLDYEKIANALYEKSTEEKNYSEEASKKVKADINNFLKVIRSDHSYTAKYVEGGKVLNKHYNELKEDKETWKKMYKTARPKGRNMRNNKIIDISWSVLTNPTSADKVLKPEGFDEQKKVGYMIAAYRNNPEISWEELEHIANDKDGIKNLKKLSYTEKDLAFFDTQLQFYKQNAAAASLIGVFAVNKIAHSTLEGDGIYLTALGSTPFTIGHKQFKERMELDPRFDTEGNNIGNVLGSLVGASADAVKDPILNLMNINMNTANILNALLRLGMSFKEAAMFLSQSVITKALAECDKQNLNGFASIRNIVGDRVKAMNQKYQFSSDSTIVTEEISPEELVEGLLEGDHEALDYKVLIAFNKILDIADKLRNPTLVTRFNSIVGAVGPLTIDNLMTEYKLENFNTIGRKTTGFEYQDENGEWQPATFSTILEKHPILAGFYSTYGLANKMFSDTPAGSRGFSKVINSLGPLGGKIMGNRQLLNSLVNFYSTFLLVDSGLVDSSKLEYYIKDFPIEFSRVKDSGKYKNNKLVESIFLKEYSKSSTPALQLNLTGLDTLSKEELSSAWIDLYNDNKSLALKLFAYNVFKGGLEFSPKTFISLLPNYIKERIVKKLPNGKSLSYVDVFRKLDFSKADPDLVVDQFVRNNWDNNSLVPYIKLSRDMLFQKNVLTMATDEDKRAVVDSPYIKMKIGSNLLLLKYDDKNSDKKVMHYKVIAPLGNNKEYLEMSPYDIVKPMSASNQGNEELETPHISSDNLVADGTTALIETPIQETATQEDSKKALSLAEMFMDYNNKYDKRKANEIIGNYKRNIEQYGKLFGPQYDLLRGVFEKQGIKLNDKQLIEKFKELC